MANRLNLVHEVGGMLTRAPQKSPSGRGTAGAVVIVTYGTTGDMRTMGGQNAG
jgi:hypothetical protein